MKMEWIEAGAAGAATQAGAYALVGDGEGRLLLVEGPSGRFYLPGGRIEPDETPERAVAREIAEECGFSARIGARLGQAVQPILGGRVALLATYWEAALLAPVGTEPDHRALWLDRRDAAAALHRAGDVAIVESWCRSRFGAVVPRGGIEPPTP